MRSHEDKATAASRATSTLPANLENLFRLLLCILVVFLEFNVVYANHPGKHLDRELQVDVALFVRSSGVDGVGVVFAKARTREGI